MKLRINKFFTQHGICSRRDADKLIAEQRVTINGRIAQLGDQVDVNDVIARDHIVVPWGNAYVYIKYNKPVGVTTTSEPHVRRNIIDEIGHAARIFPIGRLDKDSSGLILLTNDGDIVNEILRVENGHEREYLVAVDRAIDARFLEQMSNGVGIMDDITTRPCQMHQVSARQFRITLTEGRNRQIRRMCEALGYRVVTLHRTRIMHLDVDGLASGQWQELSVRERQKLFRALGRMDMQIED